LGVGVGRGAPPEVEVRDVGEPSRSGRSALVLHASRRYLAIVTEPLQPGPAQATLAARVFASAGGIANPHLIGKYPTLTAIACPSGVSTQSVKAWMSADGLARV